MHPLIRQSPGRGVSFPPALLPLALLLAACGSDAEPPAAPPAQAAPEAPPPPAKPEVPALAFRGTVQDLGAIFDAAEQRVRFDFTNTGQAALEIGEIKVTCGCTTTQLERTSFAPGEGSVIEVVYKPAGQGKLRRTVSVHSNDPAQPVVDLHIDAHIEPFVQFDPPQVLLGDLNRGQVHRIPARFRTGDPRALLLGVKSHNPNLEAQIAGEDEDGWQRLELVLSPDVPWGSFVGRVAVEVKGVVQEGAEPIAHTARLLVHGMLYDQVRANPAFLSVGLAQPEAPFHARTELVHRHGEPFALAGLELEDPVPATMTVRSEPLPGPREGHIVILEGEAGDYNGPISGTLVIATDLPDEPPLRLSVVGRVGQVAQARPGAGGHRH